MISYRRLKPKQFEEWIDHCALVFSENKEQVEGFRNYFRRHFLNDPNRNISDIFVALDDDKIVGTVRLFKRSIYIDGLLYEAGGIGEVSVNPNYERKGIASNLIKLVLEEMNELKFSLAILFASRYSFYQKFGFESVNYKYCMRKIEKADKNYKFNKATLLDSELMNQLYNNYASKINGVIDRNLYYFENWVKDEVKDLYLVEDENHNMVGYIGGYEKDDKLVIKDFAANDSEDFISIASSFASEFYPNIEYLGYPAMFNYFDPYDEKIEIPHLMAKVLSPLNDEIKTTEDLKKYLENTRYGYYETDSF